MTQPTIIPPTVGRRVHFHPGNASSINGITPAMFGFQPFDAGIAFVWNERLINISYADHYGVMHNATSVVLVQDGDPIPVGPHCRWMGHQLGQAAAQLAAQPPATDAFVAPGATLFSDPTKTAPMLTAFERLEARAAEARVNLLGDGNVSEDDLKAIGAVAFDFTTTTYGTAGEFVQKYIDDLIRTNKDDQDAARKSFDWMSQFAGFGQAIHNAYTFVPPGGESHEQQAMRLANEAQTRRLADDMETASTAGG